MDQNTFVFLIPILVSLGLFAMTFGIVYLKNKERMAMIERGMDPNTSTPKQRNSQTTTLTSGLLLIGSGLGLFIAYMMDHFSLEDRGNPAIYFSLVAVFGGTGLFVAYFIENKANKQKEL